MHSEHEFLSQTSTTLLAIFAAVLLKQVAFTILLAIWWQCCKTSDTVCGTRCSVIALATG